MHRIFLAFSVLLLTGAIALTGCGPTDKPSVDALKGEEKILPGESKPIPPGESKPIPAGDPSSSDPNVKTDADLLPVLPTLSAPTGDEKYETALSRAFVLSAEKKHAEALEALKEAQSAKETDFVKTEIEKLEAKKAREDSALKAVEAIKTVLDAGKAVDASALATDALGNFGDSDAAEAITGLKRQADALVSAGLEERVRKQKFLEEAETARKANNIRTAVVAYEQAVANGADVADVKDTYEGLRNRLAKYDESRTRAAELRKDPSQIDEAVTVLKAGLQSWDTPQIRQDISEVEAAMANRRERVAVADFEVVEDIGIANAGHAIAEEMVGNMKPRFDVVERPQVKALLAEMKVDSDSLATNDTIRTEFGRIAKARYMVLGSVNRLSGIRVDARIVDTQTGLVVQTARIAASTPAEMTDRLPALGRMLQMNDEEKRKYEQELAEQARPVAPPAANAALPPPPPPPTADAAPPPPPAPIVVYTPRPPAVGNLVVADFDGFRVVAVGAPPPPPVVVVEAPVLVRDRAFFVAVELGDNCFRRGDFRLALRHFEFALALNPGHADLRLRVMQCRPLCPAPVVVVAPRPRLVILPFAEFRDPYAPVSSIPPFLGTWTADAISPYFYSRYDVVDRGELFWWMGRLGLSMRDVMTDPYARLCLGRALGARYFLMGSLREVASFDVTTHVIDAELNVQTNGTKIRVQNASELRFRLGEVAGLTFMPPQQQVVVIQQQQVVQRQVVAAQVEFRKGNFSVSLGFYKEVLATNPNHVEARQMMIEIDLRSRRKTLEEQQLLAFRQQQAAMQAQRERQIAFAAAAEGARIQAQRDAALMNAAQQQAIVQRQLIAQQQLLNQALAAQAAKNYALQVQLLQNALAIKHQQAIAVQLAEARAIHAQYETKVAVAQGAIRLEQKKQAMAAEVYHASAELAVAKKQQEVKLVEAQQHAAAQAIEEYARFVQQAEQAKAAQKYALAVAAYQNAHRVKPSPEIQALINEMMTLQAKADAAAKGEAEKKKLETQLAQEQIKNKELEAQNAKLKAKNLELIALAQQQMQARKFEQAVASYKQAIATMQTEEAIKGLQLAQAELAKERTVADAEAKKKAEDDRIAKQLTTKLNEGRTALAAKQFDKSIAAFRAASLLKPGDLEIQKALTDAESTRDLAAAELRKKDPPAVVAKKDPEPKTNMQLDSLLTKARAAIQAKDVPTATKLLADASAIDRTSPKVRKVQADLDELRIAMAGKDLEEKNKQQAYLLALRDASSAYAAKKYEDAITAANKALKAKPGDASATKILNDSQRAMDAASTAATDAEKKKDAYDAAMKDANTAYTAKKYDAAIKAAKVALANKPNDASATNILNSSHRAMDAANTATTDAAKKKEAYDAAIKEGRAAYAKRDFDGAIKAFTEALRADPDDPTATSYLKQAREAKTAATPEPKTGVDPKRKQLYDAWLDRAEKLMATKQYDDAVEAYQNCLKALPGDAVATKGLADAKAAMAAKKDPVPPKKDPIPPKKDPMPKVDNNAAKIAAMLKEASADVDAGKYSDALQTYQDVLKLSPANAEAKKFAVFCQWMDRGKQQLADGKAPDAVTSFNQAVKIDPTDENAKKLLAQAQAAAKPKTPPKKK